MFAAVYEGIGLDNSCNGVVEVVGRVAKITRIQPYFVEGDVRGRDVLSRLFSQHKMAGVIHFAGLKFLGESVENPLVYYDANLNGLIKSRAFYGVKNLVSSCSVTVYGDPHIVPIEENLSSSATNPYGETKLIGEQILRDLGPSDGDWHTVCLRYFNPVGAHESGSIGEDPRRIPNNLMPFVAQVAIGEFERLRVFGGDYPTLDGTGVRDYIHVMDLAQGHVAALSRLFSSCTSLTVNLDTGRGYSVLDVIRSYEKASGRVIPHEIFVRRPGDIAACYANPPWSLKFLIGGRLVQPMKCVRILGAGSRRTLTGVFMPEMLFGNSRVCRTSLTWNRDVSTPELLDCVLLATTEKV